MPSSELKKLGSQIEHFFKIFFIQQLLLQFARAQVFSHFFPFRSLEHHQHLLYLFIVISANSNLVDPFKARSPLHAIGY